MIQNTSVLPTSSPPADVHNQGTVKRLSRLTLAFQDSPFGSKLYLPASSRYYKKKGSMSIKNIAFRKVPEKKYSGRAVTEGG